MVVCGDGFGRQSRHFSAMTHIRLPRNCALGRRFFSEFGNNRRASESVHDAPNRCRFCLILIFRAFSGSSLRRNPPSFEQFSPTPSSDFGFSRTFLEDIGQNPAVAVFSASRMMPVFSSGSGQAARPYAFRVRSGFCVRRPKPIAAAHRSAFPPPFAQRFLTALLRFGYHSRFSFSS